MERKADSKKDTIRGKNYDTTTERSNDTQQNDEASKTVDDLPSGEKDKNKTGGDTSLMSIEKASASIMDNYDIGNGIIKQAVKEVLRNEELQERAKHMALSMEPINDWQPWKLSGSKKRRMIVNSIPHIIEFKKITSHTIDVNLMNTLTGVYGDALDIVSKSCSLFASNTDLITYVISTKDTNGSLSYDPEQPPESSLKLARFSVTGADGTNVEDVGSYTGVLAGLLEIILKMRKCGDVYIQSPPMVAVSDILEIGPPLEIFSGKYVPSNMLENIFVGSYAHTLKWFQDYIMNNFNSDDFFIGELGDVRQVAGAAKVSSTYGVFTDSIFATLYKIHMEKHQSKKCNANVYLESIRYLAYPGSKLTVTCDRDIDIWELYYPDKVDADSYVLVYLLSQPFRQSQYNYLLKYLLDMRGLRAVSPVDRLQTTSITLDYTNSKSVVDEAILGITKNYKLIHFMETMVMEMNHAFINFETAPNFAFTSIQTAIFSLLNLAIEALLFPNLFWTNVHLFAPTLYNAWRFLDIVEYSVLIAPGYTVRHRNIVDLTKNDILEGSIPFAFAFGQVNDGGRRNGNGVVLPRKLLAFMQALRPIGTLVDLRYANARWSPNINAQSVFYVPCDYVERSRIRGIQQTTFSDRIELVGVLLRQLMRVKSTSNAILTPIDSTLTSLLNSAKTLGAVAHYEMNILYNAAVNGPEVIYTTYRGQAQPNLENFIGLTSCVPIPTASIVAIDNHAKFFHGIGLWALLSLLGDQMFTTGQFEDATTSSFQFESPKIRHDRFVESCQQCTEIGDCFGIMTYILDSITDPTSPLSFLTTVFGKSLKSGVATQILDWLLQNTTIRDLVYGPIKDTNSQLFLDLRMRAPRVTKIMVNGMPIPATPQDSRVFRQQLELLDEFELRKLLVCASQISPTGSTLHHYNQEVVVAKTSFPFYSPDNRHPDPEVEIDFELTSTDTGIETIGTQNKVYFTVYGKRWYGTYEDDFPKGVRVNITNSIYVQGYHWEYLMDAIEMAGWQVCFKGLRYIAKVNTCTHDVAIAALRSENYSWKKLISTLAGSIAQVQFFDTTHELTNLRTTLNPNSCIQYVCATSPIVRNIAVANIKGLFKPDIWVPPEHDMWTIGKRDGTNIPRFDNGLPKYKSLRPNFNNLVQIWTSNAKLESTPDIIYYPPIGSEL